MFLGEQGGRTGRTSVQINAYSFPGCQLQKALIRYLNVYQYRYHQELWQQEYSNVSKEKEIIYKKYIISLKSTQSLTDSIKQRDVVHESALCFEESEQVLLSL